VLLLERCGEMRGSGVAFIGEEGSGGRRGRWQRPIRERGQT
jgi:hypothetical protein